MLQLKRRRSECRFKVSLAVPKYFLHRYLNFIVSNLKQCFVLEMCTILEIFTRNYTQTFAHVDNRTSYQIRLGENLVLPFMNKSLMFETDQTSFRSPPFQKKFSRYKRLLVEMMSCQCQVRMT